MGIIQNGGICSWTAYPYTAQDVTFQILSFPSRPPDSTWRLSGENAVDRTSFEWPRNLPKQAPVFRFQRRSERSHEADSAYSALFVSATSCTKPEWPSRRRTGMPYSSSMLLRRRVRGPRHNRVVARAGHNHDPM